MPSGQANDGDLVGKALGGRYRVTEMIGRGGMGVVARAVDEVLGREVAVKLLRAYTDASPAELADLRTRMQREAQAAARIRHGGVVTVHDVTEEQGLPVIVMELVDGPSLDDVVSQRGALDPYEAAAIGAKLMDALDAAHRAGVLHRDVKPGNVLLERGGRVVLTDFGIATMETSDDEAMAKLTRSGELVGSLDYLPPERAQGREPGPASDIWSLGMTLYAAVEGVSPFRRTSVWSTMAAIVAEPLPEPRRAGALAPVLLALMAKEPEHRPTADQARAMLEQVAAGGAGAAPAPVPAPVAPAPVPPTPTAPSVLAAAPGFGPPPAAVDVSFPQPYAPAPQPGFPPQAPPQGPPLGPAQGPPQGPPQGQPSGEPLTVRGQGMAGADRARRRGRAAIAVAVVAVLAAGGVTYAVTKGSGGDRVRAGKPTPAPGNGSPAAGGLPGTDPSGPSPSGSGPQAKPSASASASKKPGTPSPSTTGSSPASAKPSPVPTGCSGWTHKDPKPGTYGYISGDHHLLAAPYQQCSPGALVKDGTKLWYHCYIVNSFGNQWTFVRVDGTNATGWLYNRDLTRQKGSSPPC
ncbi:serine/threonine-protein kinase [Streptomyces sp. NBC_00091]|uniref:serine/threonine-protein kinase n=1 Tax=Streptomyces sp. NBC_00091 TaxID=2975648 RepID=UPI00225A97A6|nr:serine/threonine-protein kinase [Streptomyces sp. NBC_00091]MCX5381508.1 serine/threonine protein kinase [Streptomyces sp. NBC_00091]